MKQTFKSFLMNGSAPEPLLVGDVLARYAAAGVRPVFQIVMAQPVAEDAAEG